MKRYLLTAAGKDQAGLVAAVSKILLQEGCNLEDSAMTRLQGEFAILLIFSGPPTIRSLETKVKGLGKKLGLTVHLKTVSDQGSRKKTTAGDRVLVSVYGADRPGIVHQVTEFLAKAKVNLSDLSTHRTESKGNPSGYILYLEGETTGRTTPLDLEKKLRTHLADWGVTVSVKPLSTQAL
ncbi:MAG: ACT domain-containing protein [Elusimicrobia bacterium]|jgi:glycine cleavage system transcriptional repressor|nr:ACT domain-containing protein [Elusimicrobiota bacterium]